MFLTEVSWGEKCFWWLIFQTFIIILWFLFCFVFCFFMSAWPVNSDFVPSFIVSFIFPMWFFTLQNRNSSALYSAHCWICSWPCFLVWCFVSREQVSGKKSNSFSFTFTYIFCMEIKKWSLLVDSLQFLVIVMKKTTF